MRLHSVCPVFVTAILSVLALAGCSDGNQGDQATSPPDRATADTGPTVPSAGLDSDGDGYYSYDEFTQAVDWATGQFTWPPGVDLGTNRMVPAAVDGRDMRQDQFQVGLEFDTVGAWHTCAWITAWLDAQRRDDRLAQREAMDVMTNVLPAEPNLDRGTADFMRQMAASAKLGDPSMVQQYIDANCVYMPGYPWADPDASPPPAPAASPVASSLPERTQA
jgi:hypothetical protein